MPVASAPSAPATTPDAPPAHGFIVPPDTVPEGAFFCAHHPSGHLYCRVDDEVCCNQERCIPNEGVQDADCHFVDYCGDSGHCPPGKVCCPDSYGQTGLHRRGPYDRTRCALPSQCETTPICAPGRCPAGEHCRGGTCMPRAAGVDCGSETCAGARPICVWDPTTQSGTCVDRATYDPREPTSLYYCDDHGDCGPGRLCGFDYPRRYASCCAPGSCFAHTGPTLVCRNDQSCLPMAKVLGRTMRCDTDAKGERPPGVRGSCE